MAAIMTDGTFLAWITDGAGAADLAAMVVDLYTGDHSIDRSAVAGDLTPDIVTNVLWPGYAQVAAIGFGTPVRGTDGKFQVRSDPILFSGSGTPPPSMIQVTGVFLRVTAGTTLLILGELGEGVTIEDDSQFIEIVIVIREDATVAVEYQTN